MKAATVKKNKKVTMPVSGFALDIHISNLLSVYSREEILWAIKQKGLLDGVPTTTLARVLSESHK